MAKAFHLHGIAGTLESKQNRIDAARNKRVRDGEWHNAAGCDQANGDEISEAPTVMVRPALVKWI